MLLPDDPDERDALDRAVTARLRRPLVRVRADWARDGSYEHPVADLSDWVESVEVERSQTSDLPAEVGLIDGYTSAEATVELSGARGDGRHAVDTFNPWNTGGPLYGRGLVTTDLAVDLGLATDVGQVMLRQFTGPVRKVSPDYAARTVELSALDPADRLRALITLPWGSLTRATYEADPRGYPWTTNTQWALDYVLRRNGIFASPPPPSERTLFAATLHGGHVAEIASQTFAPRSTIRLPVYSGPYYRTDPGGYAHPHDMLAPSGSFDDPPSCQYIADGQVYLAPGEGMGISVLAVLGEGPDRGTADRSRMVLVILTESGSHYLQLMADRDGGVTLEYVADGAVDMALTLPPDRFGGRDWHDLTVHMAARDRDELEVNFLTGGGTHGWGGDTFSVATLPLSGLRAATRVSVYQPVPMTNVSVWMRPDAPPAVSAPNFGHESQADLDPGLNEVTALPRVTAADSWELLQEITAAEFGLFGFAEDGRPFFTSRDTLADRTGQVVRELRTTASIKELASEANADTIRNSIAWRARPSWSSPVLETVVEAEEQREFQVVPGVTVFDIELPADVLLADGVNQVPHWDAEFWADSKDQIVHGFAAQRNAGGADVDAYADPPLMELWWELAGPRLGRLTVVNNAGERVNLAAAGDGRDGEPALKLGGQRIVDGVESVGEMRRPGSIAIYGERGYEMAESDWRQLRAPQARVAGSLLASLANPVPVIEDVPIVGDPRLRIGDLVRLTDRDQLTLRATVARTKQGASRSDGLHTTLSVRPLASPGLGVLDDDTHGRLDDTMILAP